MLEFLWERTESHAKRKRFLLYETNLKIFGIVCLEELFNTFAETSRALPLLYSPAGEVARQFFNKLIRYFAAILPSIFYRVTYHQKFLFHARPTDELTGETLLTADFHEKLPNHKRSASPVFVSVIFRRRRLQILSRANWTFFFLF